MILRQFSSNQPYLLLAVPLIAVAAICPEAQRAGLVATDLSFPLDLVLRGLVQSQWFLAIASILFVTAGAVMTNFVFNRHEFFNTPSYVPSLIYSLLGTGFCLYEVSLPALTANIFLLAGINKLLQVYRQTKALDEYFIAGFFFGMAALTFPPFISLAPGLWICVLYTRAFNWREHLVPIMAFAVPFLYWVVWKFWWRSAEQLVLFRKEISFDNDLITAAFTTPQKVFILAAAITFLLAFPRFMLSNRNSNKARNVKAIFFILAFTLFTAILLGHFLVDHWVPSTLLVPFAFIIGFWFTNYRVSLIAPVVFYGLIGCFLFLALLGGF